MWEQLSRALAALSRPAEIFFRDDDAGWNDPALQRLVLLFERARVPLDVAVIPQAIEPATAEWLAVRSGPLLGLHQHGFAHVNHEPSGRKCEFGPSRDIAAQRRDIESGLCLLRERLRLEPDPIFTPPWNRCTQETACIVRDLGFAALSRDASATSLLVAGLQHVPVTIDWMKVRAEGTPDIAEWSRLIGRQAVDGARVGIMLHHAVMEAADFVALQSLLQILREHPKAHCVPMRALLARSGSELAA